MILDSNELSNRTEACPRDDSIIFLSWYSENWDMSYYRLRTQIAVMRIRKFKNYQQVALHAYKDCIWLPYSYSNSWLVQWHLAEAYLLACACASCACAGASASPTHICVKKNPLVLLFRGVNLQKRRDNVYSSVLVGNNARPTLWNRAMRGTKLIIKFFKIELN